MEDEKPRPEPIEFPHPEPFQASRNFIEAMNRENETYSAEGLKPEIPPRSPVFGTLGDLPRPVPYSFPSPEDHPIEHLIEKVDAVIQETPQMGTEPLNIKAGVLAALYQAQALRQISAGLSELNQSLWDLRCLMRSVLTKPDETGKIAIRTYRQYRPIERSHSRMNPQEPYNDTGDPEE